MKKLLSLILTLILALSLLSLFACGDTGSGGPGAGPSGGDEDAKCRACTEFSDETAYKIRDKVMYIGRPCVKCGYIEDPIDEIELTHVVSADNPNEITDIQDKNPGVDLVIGLKKGHYPKVFVGDIERAVHVVAETGTQVVVAQANGGTKAATFENFYFYTDPVKGGTVSQVKFENAGNFAYWENIVIKNCVFEGKSKIDSSWKNGVIDNMTIEGCTFKNITGWGEGAGSACAIFTDENWGNTIIKDCVFDHIDYAAIRFGRVSTEGYFLIENCFFRDIKGNACIMFVAKNKTLQTDDSVSQVDITLEVNNCVFADTKPFSFSKKLGKMSTSGLAGQKLLEAQQFNERLAEYNAKLNVQFIIGPNTWLNIPTKISGATQYDIRQQLQYVGEL